MDLGFDISRVGFSKKVPWIDRITSILSRIVTSVVKIKFRKLETVFILFVLL